MIKNDNTRISVTIPKTLYKIIEDDAYFQGMSVGKLATKILTEYYSSILEK